MQSIADGLPPDVARLVLPDWRKSEADYWAVRDSLLSQYANQWIAFAEGAVIASKWFQNLKKPGFSSRAACYFPDPRRIYERR